MSGPRSAPSVSYPVGRCRFWAWLLGGLGAAIAAALGATAPALPLALGALLGALLLVWLGWAGWVLWRPPRGQLAWCCGLAQAPGHWGWQARGSESLAPIDVSLVLDLQQRALLRLQGPRGVPRWVWVAQGRAPGEWLALRRALVAHAA